MWTNDPFPARRALNIALTVLTLGGLSAPVRGQSLHERILADEARDRANEIIRKERELKNRDWGQPGSSQQAYRESRQEDDTAEREAARAERNRKYDEVYQQATAAFDRNDFREALRLSLKQQKLRDGPNVQTQIKYAKAGIAWNEARTAKEYRRAIAIMPEFFSADNLHYVQELELDEKYPGTEEAYQAGRAAATAGKFAEALKLYRKTLRHPRYNTPEMRRYVDKLEVWAKDEVEREAAKKEQAEQARRNRPAADRLNREADALLAAGRPEEALAKLGQALDLLPRDPHLCTLYWGAAAKVAQRNGRLDDEIAALESVLKFDPENQAAKDGLVRAQARRDEQGASIQAAFPATRARLLAGPAATNGTGAFGTNEAHPNLVASPTPVAGTNTGAMPQLLSAAAEARDDAKDLTRNYDIGNGRPAGELPVVAPARYSEKVRNDPRMEAPLRQLAGLQARRSVLEAERDALVKQRNESWDTAQMLALSQKVIQKEAEYQAKVKEVFDQEQKVEALHRMIDTEVEETKPAVPKPETLDFLPK